MRASWGFSLILISFSISCINGQVICNPNGFYCVSSSQYQLCVDDVPTGAINTCQAGTSCSNTGEVECQSDCTAAGIFPNTTDCKRYYRCTSTLIKYDYECPTTSYFNEVTSKCSMTLSPRCAEQLASTSSEAPTTSSEVPTTTPEAPTTTPEAPTTTPEAPTTTSEAPTTTSGAPTTTSEITTTSLPTTTSSTPTTSPPTTTAGPFVCPAAGVYPHPTDCTIYYRCTTGLVPSEYTCPTGSYFNEGTKKCSTVPTQKCKAQAAKKF